MARLAAMAAIVAMAALPGPVAWLEQVLALPELQDLQDPEAMPRLRAAMAVAVAWLLAAAPVATAATAATVDICPAAAAAAAAPTGDLTRGRLAMAATAEMAAFLPMAGMAVRAAPA